MGETTNEFDGGFDPSKEEGTSASLIPTGWYTAEAVDASVSITKNGKGSMLNVSWMIHDEGGEYDRRFQFSHILFQHESADATKFGRQRIKDLCDAVGITEVITNVDVFKYKQCWIYVGIERDKTGEYPDKNRVTRFRPLAPAAAEPVDMKVELNDSIPDFP
jgi:hypothetical protein